MKFEVSLERHYPHPISEVWDGLTTNEAISDWLLETRNFVAAAGARFEMLCVDDTGHLDEYRCEILEIDAPRRMVWSWVLAGNEEKGTTEVEFILTPTDTGTAVTLIHRGDRDPGMLERFKAGWPCKLEQLAELLNRRAHYPP